jgi:uncharacterized protein (DUF433 family)
MFREDAPRFAACGCRVSLVVNLVANGMSNEDITREYPELEAGDIRQVLQYASALANEEIGFFKSPAA